MKAKALHFATRLMFILVLPALLITASLAIGTNSLWLYQYGFEKYQVSRPTGLAESELDKAAAGLISYFNSDEEYISLTVIKDGQPFTLFNQREVIHLKDLKGLIWLDYRVLAATLIYVLVFTGVSLWKREKRRLAGAVLGGSSLTLVLMAVLGIGTLLDFDQLFLQFHLISFANQFWLLDPTKDYLIMLFPGGFFFDFTLFCGMVAGGMALVLGGAALAYRVLSRRRTLPD